MARPRELTLVSNHVQLTGLLPHEIVQRNDRTALPTARLGCTDLVPEGLAVFNLANFVITTAR
jgi:hypothetical protein